jgi:hypothetical protein
MQMRSPKATCLTLLFLLTLFGCGHTRTKYPPELAPFSAHLTDKGDQTLSTGQPGIRNTGRLYLVDFPFEEARKQLTPIMAKCGFVATPLIQATGMKMVGFHKVKNENYALEDLGTDPPGTCTLAYSILN